MIRSQYLGEKFLGEPARGLSGLSFRGEMIGLILEPALGVILRGILRGGVSLSILLRGVALGELRERNENKMEEDDEK